MDQTSNVVQEKLASLGIIGVRLRSSHKSLITLLFVMFKGFHRVSQLVPHDGKRRQAVGQLFVDFFLPVFLPTGPGDVFSIPGAIIRVIATGAEEKFFLF